MDKAILSAMLNFNSESTIQLALKLSIAVFSFPVHPDIGRIRSPEFNAFSYYQTHSNYFIDIRNNLALVNIEFVKPFTNLTYILVLLTKINYFTQKRRGLYADTLQPER